MSQIKISNLDRPIIPVTRRQAVDMGWDRYYPAKKCPRGHVSPRYVSNYGCIECLYIDRSCWQKENNEKHRERMRNYHKRDYRVIKNREQSAEWKRLHPEKDSEMTKRWKRENRNQVKFLNRSRRLSKSNATPKWADKELMLLIYKECPDNCVVDHIEPIKGKFVCGLHAHTNLQYLPHLQNLRKGDRQDEGGLYGRY